MISVRTLMCAEIPNTCYYRDKEAIYKDATKLLLFPIMRSWGIIEPLVERVDQVDIESKLSKIFIGALGAVPVTIAIHDEDWSNALTPFRLY